MKTQTFAVVVVGSVLLISGTGLWAYAQATGEEISICVTKAGSVHVVGSDFKRTDCTKNETLLTWNIVGPKGDKGDKGDTGEKGDKGDTGTPGQNGTSLHLVDANSQDLGILLGMPPSDLANNKYQTYLPDAKITLRLTDRLDLVDDDIRVFFLTPDCTGTPYTPTPSLYPFGYGRNGSHFYKSINTQAGNNSYLSRYDSGGICTASDGGLQGGATEVAEIPAPFTLPLAWPPKIVQE